MPPIIKRDGMLLIISGPSGAGKGTLIKMLTQGSDEFVFSCSVTTRDPRPGEVHGVDYHFITDGEYDRHLQQEAFLEYAEVHGNRYGTLRAPVDEALAEGKIMVLDIDCQGALNVMEKTKDYVSIFILPESFSALEKRLRARGTEDEETIQKRMRNARHEVTLKDRYQYNIINREGKQLEALDLLRHIISAEKQSTLRQHITISEN